MNLRSKIYMFLGANSYADYRERLLPWNEVKNFSKTIAKTNLPNTGTAFVKQLKITHRKIQSRG